MIKNAFLVVTDFGGIQEETTVLGIPCVTLRENTERPVTVDFGTNYLLGTSPTAIRETLHTIVEGQRKPGSIPPLWSGKAGERIVEALVKKKMCYEHN